MNQKGFSPINIFLGVILVIGVLGGTYYLVGIPKSIKSVLNLEQAQVPTDLQFNNSASESNTLIQSPSEDEFVKYNVDYIHADIKQYHTETGTYPKTLFDLKTVMNIDDGELNKYSHSPYFYTFKDSNYDFYAVLSTGEVYKGDIANINKHLDAKVMNDIHNLQTMVNLYYHLNQRLPVDLNEAVNSPDIGEDLKIPVNPNNGKQYLYVLKGDKKNFSISGTLSDNKEYKQESSL